MSDFEPGTVARLTLNNGVVHPSAIRLPLHEGGWASGTAKYIHSVHVADVRPLVVLDLDDPTEAAMQLRKFDRAKGGGYCFVIRDQIADQIEAQTRPPKPEEPTGLGAVVEDGSGRKWVRSGHSHTSPNWRVSGGDIWHRWDQFAAVRVLSPGVES